MTVRGSGFSAEVCECLLLDGCNPRRGLNHTEVRDSSQSDTTPALFCCLHTDTHCCLL